MECRLVFSVLVTLFCQLFQGITAEEALNAGCPAQTHYLVFALYNHDHRVIGLALGHAALIEKIRIHIALCPEDVHITDNPVKVEFQPEESLDKKARVAFEAANVTWVYKNSLLEIDLHNPVYTHRFTLTFHDPVQCPRFEVVGCETDEMCGGNDDLCGTNGTCIGAGRCICAEGMIGEKCDTPVENMTVDSYEPILQLGDTIYTKAAVFDVTGEVTLQESDTDRRRHFPFSGPCFNFFGGGGSMAFSPSANGAFSGPSDLSYPSSHNPCSAFATPWNGFSQSSDVMFGMGHDHMTPHYMYTTHGDYHNSPGSSMFYWNNMLHMHVHYPQNNPYTNVNIDVHYNITVPFFPTFGVVYNFGTSFSPMYGASMYVDGYMVGSQLDPVKTPGNNNQNPQPAALCIGQCAATSFQQSTPATTPSPVVVTPRSANVSSAGLVVAGADTSTLADNSLLTLLGIAMLNLLATEPDLPAWLEKALNNNSTISTQPPSQQTPTATALTSQDTASPSSVFTPVPAGIVITALPAIVTATSGKPTASAALTTSSSSITSAPPGASVGPLCYDCAINHLSADGSCTNITQCSAGQVCAIFEDPKGFIHRCMDEQICTLGQTTSSTQCWNCCFADLCNKNCVSSGNVSVAINPSTTRKTTTSTSTTTTTTSTTTTTTTAAPCEDDPKCKQLRGVGYGVCKDDRVAATFCKSSCGSC